MSKIILHGSIIKGEKEYKNPDIIKSIVDKKTYFINYLSLSKKKDGFYIYHDYKDKKYSGRWYTIINDIILKKNILEIELKNIEWENMESGNLEIKDVKIKIFFTENGLKKINKYINKN